MAEETYVLVSAARDEDAYVEKTILSILSQTVKPRQWVIVSDGSKDRTDEIITRYVLLHDFVKLVRWKGGRERQFASKVYALRAGISILLESPFDFIGNLDADISLAPDYYERVIGCFRTNPRLGIAGGMIREPGRPEPADSRLNSRSVRGGVQLFRRQCFQDIGGGYLPLEFGGEDAAAEVMARMKGWQVESFPGIEGYHHRKTGTAKHGVLTDRRRAGVRDYLLAYHPLFLTLKAIHRVLERPYLLGGLCMLYGYWHAWLTLRKPAVPGDVAEFLRSEQVDRMRSAWSRIVRNRQGPGGETA